MWVFYGIIYLVTGLGLFNTQRMTAYEDAVNSASC